MGALGEALTTKTRLEDSHINQILESKASDDLISIEWKLLRSQCTTNQVFKHSVSTTDSSSNSTSNYFGSFRANNANLGK